MKKLYLATIAAAFVASAYPVLAAEGAGQTVKDAATSTGHAVKEGAEATGHAVKGAAEKTGEALGFSTGEPVMASASEAAQYHAAAKTEHVMSGKITSIDQKDGAVNLKSGDTTLKIRVAPTAVHNFKDDQMATVRMAMVKLPLASGGTRAYDQPAKKHLKTGQWMKGTIDNIDHNTGVFDFKTGTATLHLHFPAAKLSALNDGDQIALATSIAHPKKKAL